MKFKMEKWCAASDCGRYGIAKALVAGEPVYTAIRLGTLERNTRSGSVMLGRADTAKQAMTLCEQDARG